MSSETVHKVSCQSCGNRIAFPPEYLDLEIDCPHCGGKTRLSLARTETELAPPVTAGAASASQAEPPKKSLRVPLLVIATAALVAVAAGGVVLFLQARAVRGILVTHWQLEPGEWPEYMVEGVVSNKLDSPSPSAHLSFTVFDDSGQRLGAATGIIPPIPPHEERRFSIKAPARADRAQLKSIRAPLFGKKKSD